MWQKPVGMMSSHLPHPPSSTRLAFPSRRWHHQILLVLLEPKLMESWDKKMSQEMLPSGRSGESYPDPPPIASHKQERSADGFCGLSHSRTHKTQMLQWEKQGLTSWLHQCLMEQMGSPTCPQPRVSSSLTWD